MDAKAATRFWEKVNRAGPVPLIRPSLGPCWVWTAGHFTRGYGCFSLDGRMQYAHRVAYEAECGAVPDGLELDHLCRVLGCVRPSHLEPVTHAENVRRGRAREPRPRHRGERNHQARLTAPIVRTIRERYKAGNTSQDALAMEFGVSQHTISRIVRRKAWAHV